MKRERYSFNFKGGRIEVFALSYEAGKILAQSEAIKRGWDWTLIV